METTLSLSSAGVMLLGAVFMLSLAVVLAVLAYTGSNFLIAMVRSMRRNAEIEDLQHHQKALSMRMLISKIESGEITPAEIAAPKSDRGSSYRY